MTVLEWLKAISRFDLSEQTFQTIVIGREINDTEDVTTLSARDKELLTADLILTAVVLSPSSTASYSVEHNGLKKSVGSETNLFAKQQLAYALSIYEKYDDEKAQIINTYLHKIRIIPIEDVI